MNPNEQNYERMKRVIECESRREVQGVLKKYNQPHFDDLAHYQEGSGKKTIAIQQHPQEEHLAPPPE